MCTGVHILRVALALIVLVVALSVPGGPAAAHPAAAVEPAALTLPAADATCACEERQECHAPSAGIAAPDGEAGGPLPHVAVSPPDDDHVRGRGPAVPLPPPKTA